MLVASLALGYVIASAPLGLQQAPKPMGDQIGPAARAQAKKFYDDNVKGQVNPIEIRGLATFIEVRNAYKKGDYLHCRATLDELWKDFPISSPLWWGANDQTHTVNVGFSGYCALLMLDDTVNWKLDPTSPTVIAKPILMEVVLYGASEGIQPRNKADLEAGTGIQVRNLLDKSLLADDYKILRDSLWVFQEYILAMTKGRMRVDLGFAYLPTRTVLMKTKILDNKTNPPSRTAFATADYSKFNSTIDAVGSELSVKPDWWWSIIPSNVPDKSPDFKTREFITGGMGRGPGVQSPNFLIDDKWMIRRPGHLGQGLYDSIEREAWMPQWFQHEFFHFLYSNYPQFELEKTGHDWHRLEAWPKDFVGLFEPDYYRESLHKRIQPKGVPSLNSKLRFAPPTSEDLARINVRTIPGVYRCTPTSNPWLLGEITVAGQGNDGNTTFKWTNSAKVSWRLYPNAATAGLIVGGDCPYYKQNIPDNKQFSLVLERDENGAYTNRIAGFNFMGAFYAKER